MMRKEGIQIEMVTRPASRLQIWMKGVLFTVVKTFVRLANA